jgi:hypothetical protein
MGLLIPHHCDGALRADEGTNAAALAVVIVDLNVPGVFIPGNAKIGTKEPTKVTASAGVVYKASARLHDCRLFIKAWFDMVRVPRRFILGSAPHFQRARFSHQHFLHITAATAMHGEK